MSMSQDALHLKRFVRNELAPSGPRSVASYLSYVASCHDDFASSTARAAAASAGRGGGEGTTGTAAADDDDGSGGAWGKGWDVWLDQSIGLATHQAR